VHRSLNTAEYLYQAKSCEARGAPSTWAHLDHLSDVADDRTAYTHRYNEKGDRRSKERKYYIKSMTESSCPCAR
jgi:hypothetical protein